METEFLPEYLALTEENTRLKAELEALQIEHSTVIITVIKTLKSVGLWPIAEGDNITAKAIKGVKSVITESMINPGKLADRFSFMKEIFPLCEKYKNIEV
jgi:hypothetical protein